LSISRKAANTLCLFQLFDITSLLSLHHIAQHENHLINRFCHYYTCCKAYRATVSTRVGDNYKNKQWFDKFKV